MISGITFGVAVFIIRIYKNFIKKLNETEQPTIVDMINVYLAKKTTYLGTAIIGTIALIFTNVCNKMAFWEGIGAFILIFGGLSTMMAFVLTKDLESSIKYTGDRKQ